MTTVVQTCHREVMHLERKTHKQTIPKKNAKLVPSCQFCLILRPVQSLTRFAKSWDSWSPWRRRDRLPEGGRGLGSSVSGP